MILLAWPASGTSPSYTYMFLSSSCSSSSLVDKALKEFHEYALPNIFLCIFSMDSLLIFLYNFSHEFILIVKFLDITFSTFSYYGLLFFFSLLFRDLWLWKQTLECMLTQHLSFTAKFYVFSLGMPAYCLLNLLSFVDQNFSPLRTFCFMEALFINEMKSWNILFQSNMIATIMQKGLRRVVLFLETWGNYKIIVLCRLGQFFQNHIYQNTCLCKVSSLPCPANCQEGLIWILKVRNSHTIFWILLKKTPEIFLWSSKVFHPWRYLLTFSFYPWWRVDMILI